MNVDLDKRDLICMVRGTAPHHSKMYELEEYGFPCLNKMGWSWREDKLFSMSELELRGLYLECKNSWVVDAYCSEDMK